MFKVVKILSLFTGFCVVLIIGYVGMKYFTVNNYTLTKSAENIDKVITSPSDNSNTPAKSSTVTLEEAGTAIAKGTVEIINKAKVTAEELKPRLDEALDKFKKKDPDSDAEQFTGNNIDQAKQNFVTNESRKRESNEMANENDLLDSAHQTLTEAAKLLR